MSAFWFLHLCHVYLKILFPIQLKFLDRPSWSRRLHITEVTGAIIVSAIGPSAVWISSSEYNLITMPPIMCFPVSTQLTIYTTFIPLVVLSTIGVCVIITILWTLIKVSADIYNFI